MDIRFNCPSCDQSLCVDESGTGLEVDCPTCKQRIRIPEKAKAAEVSQVTSSTRPDSPLKKSQSAGSRIGWAILSVLGLASSSAVIKECQVERQKQQSIEQLRVQTTVWIPNTLDGRMWPYPDVQILRSGVGYVKFRTADGRGD